MRSNPYRIALLVASLLLAAVGFLAMWIAAGHERNGTTGMAELTTEFSRAMLHGAWITFLAWLVVSAVVRAIADRPARREP